MCSRCRDRVVAALAAALLALGLHATARDLVVCADPDNLPFSREDRSGLEDRIAELVADDIGATLVYRWQPLRRGAIRKTLGANACNMLVGVPVGTPGLATTSAYYRSGYAFVSRRDWGPPIVSFDDPRLRDAAIGVQLVGADMAATPAALALARRRIVENVTGFPVYGAEPSAQRMIDAVADRRLDVAIVWGPQAGYFARRARTPLAVELARGEETGAPFTFAIAIGVREADTTLRDELDLALVHARERIVRALVEFGVPLAPAASAESPR